MKMTPYDATMIAEGCYDGDVDEEKYLEAWQLLIDTGLVWQLQGTFGRQAKILIEAGECTP
jgi:hypothetical protein